jgi:hypothetical protein
MEEIQQTEEEKIEVLAQATEKKLDQIDYQKSVMYEQILLKK